ncbi:unannotated protein [freshwater metagenome]|uniref:Unannotated protein n=1 Tax=freshwater metagenome TaxID=449393 RepID=A0A6J7EFB6_9ZZZZ
MRALLAVLVGDQLVAHDPHPLDAFAAEDLDRRRQEAQHDPPAMAMRRPHGVVANQLDVVAGRAVGGIAREPGDGGRVEIHIGGIDDDVGILELTQLAQLGRRVRRLGRAAASEQDDLLDPGAGECRDRRVRRIGDRQLLLGQHQHPRDVDGHVAVADYDGTRTGELERVVGGVRMAVVPGDEIGGGHAARQILAGDPEAAVERRTVGVDDRMVMVEQLGVRDVAADLDMAVEAEALKGGGPLEDARH